MVYCIDNRIVTLISIFLDGTLAILIGNDYAMKVASYPSPILLLPFLFLCINTDAQNFEDVEIVTTKVSDHVYMLEGSGGNIGVCVGKDGPILIDDQYAPLSEKIKEAIHAITDLPVQFVINTHFHHDHSGGNEVFAETAHIIAHENARKRIRDYEQDQVEQGNQSVVNSAALPALVFNDDMTVYQNDMEIDLIYITHAHTDGDVAVYFKAENVIHMGDLYVQYGWPFVDMMKGGNVLGMVESLDHILSVIDGDTKIIPGHGKLATRSEMIAFNDMLRTVIARVRSAKQNGKSLEEILEMKPMEGYENVEGDAASFLERVFLSLDM